VEEMRNMYIILAGKHARKETIWEICSDGMIILKLIFEQWVEMWNEFKCLVIEHGQNGEL
jgi:hypothetical protein